MSIKTYVMRGGRITVSQQRDYNELSPLWCVPFSDRFFDSASIFGNTNPLIIEIGFGMGTATVAVAEANPECNYLGIEVYRNGVGKLLGEIKRRELQNLRIVEHDALEVISTMIADGSVRGFHIFFPDPWPKKKHHKRRLVQRPHTDLLASKLANNGYLYFVTDWEPYAHFAHDMLDTTPGIKNKYDGFAPRQEWRPETKFERKGKENERVIWELLYEKLDTTA
jgi:tRNA (guanine-N7-)-methyltransferase